MFPQLKGHRRCEKAVLACVCPVCKDETTPGHNTAEHPITLHPITTLFIRALGPLGGSGHQPWGWAKPVNVRLQLPEVGASHYPVCVALHTRGLQLIRHGLVQCSTENSMCLGTHMGNSYACVKR